MQLQLQLVLPVAAALESHRHIIDTNKLQCCVKRAKYSWILQRVKYQAKRTIAKIGVIIIILYFLFLSI